MTTLVEQYLDYSKKYIAQYGSNTIVLMQVGTFFECYAIQRMDGTYEGSNIQDFASINDMIIAKKNTCVGDNINVVMAGFGIAQLEKYVKKLLNHDYTVAVITQDVQAKNTTRSLSCIYSPGTYFNANDSSDSYNSDGNKANYNSGLSNNTVCIWLHYSKANQIIKTAQITIGISVIDILTGKLINYEYNHPFINSPTTYDQLEKYIAIYNPVEVIIISNYAENNYIDDVISYANIQNTKIHKIYLILNKDNEKKENDKKNNKETDKKNERNDKIFTTDFERIAINCEKQRYQEAVIDKIYGIGSFQERTEFHNYAIANQSLCFLLDFVEKHNPVLIKNIDYPIFEDHCNKLI